MGHTSDIKGELLKRIQETDDEALLQQLKALLDLHRAEHWNSLPSDVRLSILEGYAQSERGEGIPHEDLMKKARTWGGR